MKLHNAELVIILVFGTLAVSCGGNIEVERRLDDVATYIQEAPDSALAVIRSIDTLDLGCKRVWAKYSLLQAMALDKNYIDTTDVRVIMPAVRYYDRKGDADKQMRSYYYQGRIQYNGEDYTAAIVSYTNALNYTDSSSDLKMKGMIFAAIGSVYNQTYCSADELKYKLLAHDCFEKSGDSLGVDYSRINLAIAYHNCHDGFKSDSILCSVSSPRLIGRAKSLLAENEIKKNKPDAGKVVSLYDELRDSSYRFSVLQYYDYAYALALLGRFSEADRMVDRLSSVPATAESMWRRYKICKLSGRTADALALYEDYSIRRDSIVKVQLSQSVYKALGQYYDSRSEIAKNEAAKARITTWLIILICVLMISISYILFQHHALRLRRINETLSLQRGEAARMLERIEVKRQNELMASHSKISQLTLENQEMSSVLMNLRNEFAYMYRAQFREINKMFSKGYDLQTFTEKTKKAYADKYGEMVSELYHHRDKQRDFENRINEQLDGIMRKLRADFPEFSEDNFRLASYVIVGFDGSAIAFLLDVSKNNVWVKKHRLSQKILSKDTANAEQYKIFFKSKTYK